MPRATHSFLAGIASLVAAIHAAPAGDIPLNTPANGVLVLEVVEGSQAKDVGIREHDIVVSCNATPTPDIESLRNAMNAAASTETVVLAVYRGNEELRLKVRPGFLGIRGVGSIEGVPSQVARSQEYIALRFQLGLVALAGLALWLIVFVGAVLRVRKLARGPQWLELLGSGTVVAFGLLGLVLAATGTVLAATGLVRAIEILMLLGLVCFSVGYIAESLQNSRVGQR